MRVTPVLAMILAFAVSSSEAQVTFSNLAHELNMDDADDSRGAAVIDIDGDEIVEVIITNIGGINRLYKWQDSVYIDMAEYFNINYVILSNNITVADINFDGKPDIIINDAPDHHTACLYVNRTPEPFVDVAEEYNVDYIDYNGAAFFQMTPASGLCLLLGRKLMSLQNDTFIDITYGSGLENLTNVFCPVFLDMDGDIDDDLFIAGDCERNEGVLFRNNGDGTFTDISTNTDEGGFGYGQEVAFGDIDCDGDFDLYITSGYGTNTMWENDGTGFFYNITDISNTGYGGYSRSSTFGDFDNDCDVDIFVNRTSDYKVLFLNDGNGVFIDYSHEAGVDNYAVGTGCSSGDLNGDSQLDIIANNANGVPNEIYINQNSDSSFLNVKVTGRGENTLALGAIVELYTYSGPTSEDVLIGKREISSHPIACGFNQLTAHFGTGDHRKLRVVVRFQSLAIVDTSGIMPGQTIEICEPDPTSTDDPRPALPDNRIYLSAYPNPFNTSTLISFHGTGSDTYDLIICDLLGRQVKKATLHAAPSGRSYYVWEGRSDSSEPLPTGVYFVRIRSDRASSKIRVTLIR